MATATLRPNGTAFNQGWTIGGGAASHHAAVNDNNDATYIQAIPGGWLCVFDFDALTLPAHAQIRSVSVRVRRRGNSSAVFDVAIGYLPDTGSYRSIVLSSGERPTSTIATRTYGSLVQAPGGVAWNNSNILPRIQVSVSAGDTNIRVYEIYLDVVYDEAPTCVITAPVGDLTGSQIPAVTWTYSDTEGSTQERVRVKVFNAAQVAVSGFSPDVSDAYWDSGVVLTSATSMQIGTPLVRDTYRVYVRVADAGSSGRFGPWAEAEFSVGGGLPATPTISVSVDSDNRRNAITVNQNDNRLSYGQSTMSAKDGEGDGWYADHNTVLDSISSEAPSSIVRQESFTGPNGALSSANTDLNWTVLQGAFSVQSNQLTSPTSGIGFTNLAWLRLDDTVGSDDHYAQFTVNTLAPSTNRCAMLWLRAAASGISGYVVELKEQFDQYTVWRVGNNAYHAITGWRSLPQPLVTPCTWRAEIRGNQISVFLNGTLLGVHNTDGVITTGVRTGIVIHNGGSVVLLDNFEAGDLNQVVDKGDEEGDLGEWLGEMTVTDARPGAMFTGGRNGWGTPVTEGEIVTLTAAAWQNANQSRDVALDAEYYNSSGPLTEIVFEDRFQTPAAAWDTGLWTSNHLSGADDSIPSTGVARLTTGSTAFGSPARMIATGMPVVGDSEVAVRMVFSDVTSDVRGLVGLRATNSWFFSTLYPDHGYSVEVLSTGTITVRKGTGTVLNGFGASHTVLNEGIWVRLRVRDLPDRSTCLIQAKWWDATEDEPEQWDYVVEDADFFGHTGQLALSATTGTANVRTVDFSPVAVDNLSCHDFGRTWQTRNDGKLASASRDAVVPAGATYCKLVARAFPTGASEVFVWSQAGVIGGSGRSWSRGGLTADNMYGPNESSFENAAAGVAGWEGIDEATVARGTYPSAASGAALDLEWDSSSSAGLILAAGPGKLAEAGENYAIRALVRRVSPVAACRVGLEFRDTSGGVLARSFSTDILPDVGLEWRDSGSYTMAAPEGTATVHAVFAASPVDGAVSAAITAVRVVPGTVAPEVYQPGPLARAYARVEYSDNGGLVWELVRGTTRAFYGSDFTVLVYDYESPPGATRVYRASTAAVDFFLDSGGGATVVSEPSNEVFATLPAFGFWLRDPLVPARLLEIKHSGDLDQTSIEPQEVHVILSRPNPVIVSDGIKGEQFVLPLTFVGAEGWRQFEEMRRAGSPLLFQSDFDGQQWYIKLGPTRRSILKRSQNRLNEPIRMVEITANEVDRPDPEESNSGIVTQTVWKTV